MLYKIIETPYSYYLYETNKNQVYKVKEKQIRKLSENEETKNSLKISSGYISDNLPTTIEHPNTRKLPYLYKGIKQIILQVTQNCNFNCNYCLYSQYGSTNRCHTNKTMSFEVAKKAVDFYLRNSTDNNKVVIGFYGGEPLLNLGLIRKIVSYSEQIFEGKTLDFVITTNGSLLTADIFKYLIDHNFQITISLDGPQDIHDRSRVFMHDGKGTFNTILTNLQNIYDCYPLYYNKIFFNVVVNPMYNLSSVVSFFDNHYFFKDNYVRLNTIDDSGLLEKHELSEEFVIEYRTYMFKYIMSMFGKYRHNNIPNCLKSILNMDYESIKSSFYPTPDLPSTATHGGPCIPGRTRLFIDVDGRFFPCERVSEKNTEFNIGNIIKGMDLAKCRNIINIAKLTEEKCKKCWAIRLCSICAKECDDNGHISKKFKETLCVSKKESAINKLRFFILLDELNNIYDEKAKLIN